MGAPRGGGYIGAEAATARAAVQERALVCLVLEDSRAMVIGNEPAFSDGRVVARVTSGGIGYAVGNSIAFASLPLDLAAPGSPLAVRVFDRIVPARVAETPLYDPTGERLRG